MTVKDEVLEIFKKAYAGNSKIEQILVYVSNYNYNKIDKLFYISDFYAEHKRNTLMQDWNIKFSMGFNKDVQNIKGQDDVTSFVLNDILFLEQGDIDFFVHNLQFLINNNIDTLFILIIFLREMMS